MSSTAMATKWTGPFSGLEPVHRSAELYTSPEIFELERQKVFSKVWLNIGRECEIPEPGNFIVRHLEVCKAVLLIVRGLDRKVRAFHNVCSHRCNFVEPRSNGRAKGFRCKYHGWAYGLRGELVSIPDEAGYGNVDKARLGLTEVPCDSWQGFIFVNMDQKPPSSLQEFLGDWGRSMEGYPFQMATERSTTSAEIGCNWKVVLDAFQESFHFAFIHSRTAGPMFTSLDEPYTKVYDVRLYDSHRSISSPEMNPNYRPSSIDMALLQFAGRPGGHEMAAEVARHGATGVNPRRAAGWVTDMNCVFPNTNIQVFSNHILHYQFWPLAVNRTRVEIHSYDPPATTNAQRVTCEFHLCFLRDVFLEDFSTLERTQQGLESGAKKELGPLHEKEVLIRHSHKVLNEYLRR